MIDSGPYGDMFGAAEIPRVFSDERLVKPWLRVERVLAAAQPPE